MSREHWVIKNSREDLLSSILFPSEDSAKETMRRMKLSGFHKIKDAYVEKVDLIKA